MLKDEGNTFTEVSSSLSAVLILMEKLAISRTQGELNINMQNKNLINICYELIAK